MQISSVNDVKIYNLSHGKSLPEWLSDRKKRDLQKKDVDVQRRIELIQDFEMPTVCTSIKVSRDGQYIIAAGTYKPRVRCYDTYQLSLKFERCLDSDGSQSGRYRPTCLPRGTATTLLLCPLVMDLLCS